MKALVFKGPGVIEYASMDFSNKPDPEEVLIAVHACCICGSDLHAYKNGGPGRIPPMIMGHEFAGVVEAIGVEVTKFQAGDRVTVQPSCFCGKCGYCLQGSTNLCDNKRFYGVKDLNGAMAEYIRVDQKQVFTLPDDISFEHAAMLEPLAVAYQAVSKADDIKGKTAVVVGAGPIGLLILQVLRLRGASSVLVIDLNQQRLELAKQLGAADTLNAQSSDPAQWVRDRTNQNGADLAFEAVGVSATVQTAMQCLAKGGRCVWVGNAEQMIQIDMKKVVLRELEIFGTYAYTNESFGQTLEFLSTYPINMDLLISRKVPLGKGAAAFEKLAGGTGDLMKIILTND